METPTVQPRARHSRNDVILAALRLLQDHGLAELTMRRLAGELGVQPSALYWHVPNKQTLLAELSDRIVARSETGQSSVLELARALRFALLSCRDGAEVVSGSLALGLGGLEAQRRLSAAITATGTDETTANAAATILVHQVLGQVWHEQQRQTAELLGVPIARDPGVPDDPESHVDLGVRLIMAGLANAPAAIGSKAQPREG